MAKAAVVTEQEVELAVMVLFPSPNHPPTSAEVGMVRRALELFVAKREASSE